MAERRDRRWTLADIPWHRFDASRVDPELLKVVKAASLVEYNAGHYADYLCNVFGDDRTFQHDARNWAHEEMQHGEALAEWARLADPGYDFEASFRRFAEVIKLPVEATASMRGSRCGELIARCMVEVGTSSYYTALAEAAAEPVLKTICAKIAADELRHYKLFYTHMKRYRDQEGVGLWRRLWIALGRIGESQDDELAYAYYAANGAAGPYSRRRSSRAYAGRAYRFYRPHHVERAMAMIFKAVGLKPHGRLCLALTRLTYRFMTFRARRLAAA